MTDRPIIFSAPMILALLAGRKSQTRRVLPQQPPEWATFCQQPEMLNVEHRWVPSGLWRWSEPEQVPHRHLRQWPVDEEGMHFWLRLPYSVGDRLWVRENHYRTDDGDSEYAVCAVDADEVREHLAAIDALPAWFNPDLRAAHKRLRPSIHMPRWASRLTLPVLDVRVQRLLDITEQDAEAEGVCHFVEQGHPGRSFERLSGAERSALVRDIYGSSREAFRALWEGLHGQGSWNANPWVVAVGVDVHHANIDALEAGRAAA